MPELPEVETIKRTLESLVTGKTITGVSVHWPKIVQYPKDLEEFKRLLTGQRIRRMGRRGKFLLFYMDEVTLVSHLRMEGKYGIFPENSPADKHTHVVFSFAGGMELRYRDVRKFGTMHVFEAGTEESRLPLSKLGPEPFSGDFSLSYFAEKLGKTKRIIKSVLLDQTVVAGIGNIYADESLYRAGIHPERPAQSLTKKEITTLHREIIATLGEAVEMGGTTIRSYVNSMGEIGMFQLNLNAYGREGQACKCCGSPIEKRKIAGRGTHFCPQCQV